MKQDLGPLGMIDFLTDSELRQSLGHHFDAVVRDWVRGIKLIRLPIMYGASNGSGAQVSPVFMPGPQSGYIWDVKRITVGGPAIYGSSGGPFMNIYKSNTIGDVQDTQFMAGLVVNNATYFSKLSLSFFGGENLGFSGGGFANNAEFYVTGQVLEVPAEMVGKIVLRIPRGKRANQGGCRHYRTQPR
jgi:hypothetical protein